MRKTTTAVTTLALAALALTGCTAASTPSFDGTACDRSSNATLERAVSVTGEIGTPKVTVNSPVGTAKVAYADLIIGDGEPITSATQNAILTRMLINGTTGEPIHSALSVWSPETASAELPGVEQALACATEGSRIVVSIPSADLPEGMAEQVDLGADDAMVAVYDVRYTLMAKAQGRDVFNDARNLPTVVRASDGRPGIIIPDGDAPTKTVTQTLIEGDGDVVGDGQAMYNYTAVAWSSRQVTGSSWDTAVSIDATSLPEEVQKAISEATIGSQLLVVIPAEGDATAFVVDVLGVIPEELTQG